MLIEICTKCGRRFEIYVLEDGDVPMWCPRCELRNTFIGSIPAEMSKLNPVQRALAVEALEEIDCAPPCDEDVIPEI